MKRLLIAVLGLASASACKPGASSAEPDTRLGTMFAQSSEVNSQPEQGSANFFSFAFGVDSQGTVHAVGTWNPTREFGSTEVHVGSSRYWRVGKDGKVEEKAGPTYATGASTRLSLILGLDDQPTLVQYDGLGAGKAVTLFTLEAGSRWVEKSLFVSQYPGQLTARTFGDDDQIRALGGGEFVVLLQNQMLRSVGDTWVPVAFPPSAIKVHLVNADATNVRVVWTEPDNRLATGVFSRATWSLDLTHVARVQLNGVPDFHDNFNVAGSVEAFVVDLDVDTGWASYRYSADVLSRVDAATGEARVPLLLTSHPTRAVRGYRTGVFQGRDSGSVSAISPGLQTLTCVPATAPTGMPASPYPDSAEVRKCINRRVDIRMTPEVDVSGMVLVTFDRKQDIVTRVYVKHVPFPIPADPFFSEPQVGGGFTFTGDDGGTDTGGNGLTRVSGRALIVGEAVHSRIKATLTSTINAAMTATFDVADNGAYRSAVVPSGQYLLTLDCPGYESATKMVTVADAEVTVDPVVLDGAGIVQAPVPPRPIIGHTASRVYYRQGSQLTFADYGVSPVKLTTISVQVDAVPPILFTTDTPNNDALIGFTSIGVIKFVAPGASVALPNTGIVMSEYRLLGTLPPVAPDGPVDGQP